MSSQKKTTENQGILVFIVNKETQCAECKETLGPGRWITTESKRALCLACADLDHLEFLPAGDPAMTRRATKYSQLYAKVLKWSRSRKRYERQGILVEAEALKQAEEECLSDQDLRLARQTREKVKREEIDQQYAQDFAEYILKILPGCPMDSANQIAQHACLKYSGRVGRSAAAKAFEKQAVLLAVRAHVRHVHTRYDEYLMAGHDRDASRSMVIKDVDAILKKWMM